MKKTAIVISIITLMAIPFRVLADDKDIAKAGLEEIVVTASRTEEAKKDVTFNITVIDEDEIKNSSARDLGDLLAEKAGVYIRKYPGALTSVGLRSFRTETHGNDLQSYVLILLDGRRAGTGNLAKIMTKNIEKIEIIRGPAAVQYGSAAMGGVINVITKQGKGKTAIFVEGMLGSYGYEETSAGFSGKIKNLDFSGSFTRSTMNDYDIADGDKFDNTDFDEKTNYSLNIGFEFMPGNRIGIIYTDFDVDRIGSPGYFSATDLDDFSDKSNKSTDLVYEGRTSQGIFSWKARYFNGEDDDKWSDPTASNPDFWDNGIPSKMATDRDGAQGQLSLNMEDFSITAGFDWVNYEIKTTWDPKKTEYDNMAGFVLGKGKFFDQRLIIAGGIRYDEYEVEVKGTDGTDEDDDNLTPSIGAAYLINDYLKVRLNYAKAFKMPNAKEMAADYVAWGTHYVGNPDLDPETSKTYEGGLDFSYSGFNSSFTYFYTDFEDKIESVTTPAGDRSWENIGDATISGFEGEFSYDIGAIFDWRFKLMPYVNIVYLDTFEDDTTDKDLQYTSDITASYGITFSGLEGFTANLCFSYTGDQKITDYEGGTYQRMKKGGFTVADLTVSKEIMNFGEYGKATIRGEIQNIFDKDYEYVQGYPMPGRSFVIGLRYDL